MADMFNNCHECGKNCIETAFCSEGASFDNSQTGGISVPRNLKVKVIANPAFWGFEGVLISGWARYENGHFDYFDGFQESHLAERTCNSITYGPFMNEQRPDVLYRSVFDPDGTKHYGSDGTLDGVERGGAEVYLIDRAAGEVEPVSEDNPSCDTTKPTQVFKKFPENYGFGNKINFKESVYKNATGAWRMTSLESCYSTASYSEYHVKECDDTYKEHFIHDDMFGGEYDPSSFRVMSTIERYVPDTGSITFLWPAPSGASTITGTRSIDGAPYGAIAGAITFLQTFANKNYYSLAYNSADRPAAEGRVNYTFVDGTYTENATLRVSASGDRRSCLPDGAMAGRYAGLIKPTGSIVRDTGVSYLAAATISYNGAPASGLKEGMVLSFTDVGSYSKSYHIHSVSHSGAYTRVELLGTWSTTNDSVNGSGSWVAHNTYDSNTCCGGSAYGIDNDLKQFSNQAQYHSDFGKIFNNNKNKIQSNRFPENRYTYQADTVSPISSGYRKDYSYPSVSDSGTVEMSSGVPVFDRTLPYYGPFFEVDLFDSQTRHDSSYNTTIGRNGTCYSKKATLDIFPDCVTQFIQYDECVTETDLYSTNRLQRLAFVYRGCDFADDCSFDGSGRPIAGWSGGTPTNIQDLKRGLAGQELYMYLNLSTAWGGVIKRCPCDCSEDPPAGELPPTMVQVLSPVSFPCLLAFDLHPEVYGCHDTRYQVSKYKEYLSTSFSHELCDPFPALPEACNVRQPYTTYGFMRNLCGKESRDRKDVITSAFANLHQSGEYRNSTPSVDVDAPMYWEFQNYGPEPPVFGSGDWNGATSDNGKFHDSGLYPYWGLSDQNGALVSPYFAAKSGEFLCCPTDSPTNYVDFDGSGTFFNGWPTDRVPFLIEIDHDDMCAGCGTVTMENRDLMLTLEGMDTKYLHNLDYSSSTGGKYGYNNCKYKGAVLNPTYNCASGYSPSYCSSGDSIAAEYGQPYTGSTCACIDGTEIPLRVKTIAGSNLVIGWQSSGVNNSFVEISGCNDMASNYIIEDYFPAAPAGLLVYGSFTLACAENIPYVTEPSFPFSFYTGDSVSNLWSCSDGSCVESYPAQDGNLALRAKFFVVSQPMRAQFEALTEQELQGFSGSDPAIILRDGIKVGPPINNTAANITLCSGEKVFLYGCAIGGSFYPCAGCTPESVCVSCSGQGVVCDSCDEVVSVNGVATRRVPAHYELNACKCQCSTPTLMREYDVTNTGLVLAVSYEPYGCVGTGYWISISGANRVTDPFLINPSPPYVHIGVGPYTNDAISYCSYHTGPNAEVDNIYYKFTEPSKDVDCLHLTPETCSTGPCLDERASSSVCGDPVPFTGVPASGLTVNRRSCFPEIMIVNKIDCLATGYALHVSREYHSHDRTWRDSEIVDLEPTCVTRYGAYNDGVSCTQIPYAVPSDSVTPAYDGPCDIHPASGEFANQDFQYGTLWNYFNLYYASGVPSSYYKASVSPTGCEILTTPLDTTVIFGSGEPNKRHSCIQDIGECGGDFFCNKMFFPRRNYASGTKVTAFGALSICTQNAQHKTPSWYSGYQSFDQVPKVLSESLLGKLIDPCDPDMTATTMYDMGIDDTIIYVDDYLPLVGISAPSFRSTIDVKSCVIAKSGEDCNVTLPMTHTDATLGVAFNGPSTLIQDGFDSMGYFTSTEASGSNNCLFNKFKIFVDVECCPDRVRRVNSTLDSPTMLNYVFTDVNAAVCNGLVTAPACGCAGSTCGSSFVDPGVCTAVKLITEVYGKIECSGVEYAGGFPIYLNRALIDYDGTAVRASTVSQGRLDCDHEPYPLELYESDCVSGVFAVEEYSIRTWQCGDVVYGNLESAKQRDCCDIVGYSRCSVIASGVKFGVDASCVFMDSHISGESLTDVNAGWRTKCDCTSVLGDEMPCSDGSMIKATITELI